MIKDKIFDIKKIRKDLKTNGISHIKNYMSNSVELIYLNKKIHYLVCILARKYNLANPEESLEDIERTIFKLNKINNKISGFLNDSLNVMPELYRLLTSKKIEKLAKDILIIKDNALLSNNYRFRVQIPNRDEISNLPWHQDLHYNNLYNYNSSVVIWLSVSDIDIEKGPIVYKKGSHILKKVPMIDWVKPNGARVFTVPEKYIEDSKFEDCFIPTKKGDILLIDLNLLHRSGFNKSKNKTKLSLQGRFHNSSADGFLSEYF